MYLCVIDWALDLSSGSKRQIFTVETLQSVFRSLSIEDVSIIRRSVGVVLNSFPSQRYQSTNNLRTQQRVYVLDPLI